MTVIPPNKPWKELEGSDKQAAIAYYISDSKSKIPVRDITNRNDPKADPNIETKTFGLFSYCHKDMRKSMINNNVNLLFFVTRRLQESIENGEKKLNGLRVLTGYYDVKWYYEVASGDFMLAANSCKFVYPGFPIDDLTEYLSESLNTGFLQWKYLCNEVPNLLLRLLEQTPDSTQLYLDEVRRMEQIASEKWGHTYRNITKSFDWNEANRVMKL